MCGPRAVGPCPRAVACCSLEDWPQSQHQFSVPRGQGGEKQNSFLVSGSLLRSKVETSHSSARAGGSQTTSSPGAASSSCPWQVKSPVGPSFLYLGSGDDGPDPTDLWCGQTDHLRQESVCQAEADVGRGWARRPTSGAGPVDTWFRSPLRGRGRGKVWSGPCGEARFPGAWAWPRPALCRL